MVRVTIFVYIPTIFFMKKKKKIRLWTVFSWIWAIEQAFIQKWLEYEIAFACDNWDIDIDIDYDEELKKVKWLQTIQDKKIYVEQLYKTHSRKTNFVKISYEANYKIENDNFFYDVKLLDWSDFTNNIDIFVWGSPCQSFSIAGARWWFEDARGTLFYDYCRLVNEIKPKVFIYENVYWVLTHDKWNTRKVMQNSFNQLWYSYKREILDARDYWIPQWRRRLFVVWFKDEKDFNHFEFPKPIKLKLTMQDLLLENAKEWNVWFKDWELSILKKWWQETNQKLFLSQKLIDYVMSPWTKNFYHENAEIDLPVARALLSTMWNTHRASVNNYVTTQWRIRALDPRETHRLMWFPDTYKIAVSKAQAYKQSWNAIVVSVLKHILDKIYW